MGGWLFLLGMGVVGFVAQAVDGTLGMGYGVFSTSLLVGIGLAPAIASASVHTAEAVTTLVSGVSHWRLGNVRWKLFWRLVLPGCGGGHDGRVFPGLDPRQADETGGVRDAAGDGRTGALSLSYS